MVRETIVAREEVLMKTLSEPAQTMETPLRKQTRDDQGKPDNLVPVNTALPPDIVELVEAEASLEYITPSQVLRRIVVKHYRSIGRQKRG
jgi:hypothetical protein